jgi:hypothetical protein
LKSAFRCKNYRLKYSAICREALSGSTAATKIYPTFPAYAYARCFSVIVAGSCYRSFEAGVTCRFYYCIYVSETVYFGGCRPIYHKTMKAGDSFRYLTRPIFGFVIFILAPLSNIEASCNSQPVLSFNDWASILNNFTRNVTGPL